MKIDVEWSEPDILKDGSANSLIYEIDGLDEWEEFPGVYMFCRKHGGSLIPLYIGRSTNVPRRIRQHLNTTKMMIAIKQSKAGEKILVVGEISAKGGQKIEALTKIVESSLIDNALTEGYELINKAGTKPKVHTIDFRGYQKAKTFSGSTMFSRTAR